MILTGALENLFPRAPAAFAGWSGIISMKLEGSSIVSGGDPFSLAPLRPPEAANRQPGVIRFFRLHPVTGLGIVCGSVGTPAFAPMPEETSQQADDRRLLAEIVNGKPDAFAALYDRLSGPLFTLCLRMVGDAEEAEDILQEAFLTIWRRADSYDGTRSSVFSWAVHLTRCKAIDHLRSRGRRLRLLGPTIPHGENGTDALQAALPEAAAATLSASDDADRNEQAARVRRELSALPPEQIQAIEMAFFGDLSHHEISARLAQPLGTVKARIRRGLLKLRDGLRKK